jgi:hypothetical protein
LENCHGQKRNRSPSSLIRPIKYACEYLNLRRRGILVLPAAAALGARPVQAQPAGCLAPLLHI